MKIPKAKKGHHYHKCPSCGRVWQHSDKKAGNERAHRCPQKGCKGQSWLSWRPQC